MNYLNTASQLSFITVVCFSFSILTCTLLLDREKNLSRLLGICFSIPFLLTVFAFISHNALLSVSLFSFSQGSLLLVIFIILAFKLKSKMHGLINTFILFYTMLVIILASGSNKFFEFITASTICTVFVIASSLLVMFILRKEKGSKSPLFWASLALLTQSALKLIVNNSYSDYLTLPLYISAYYLFFHYFYKEVIEKILTKIKYAEKQLDAVDKNLNLEVRKRVLEIERSNEVLINISKTDALTKALNKAAILDTIGNLISTAKPGTEFALLMFDIDKFKTINDTLGHIVGDKCIKKLALIAKHSLREIDFLGRYGGDEFIIVIPGASVSQAKLIAERFRRKVEETESPHFTVSIGLSVYPQDGNSVRELLSAADDGLYLSKSKGRNAVSYKNVF